MLSVVTEPQPEVEPTSPPPVRQRRRLRGLPLAVLIGVVICFTLAASAVLALTPPWEANDEPYHVINVQTIVGGHLYHIASYNDGNLESHQAPLYYMVLAAYQKAMGVPKQQVSLAFAPIADGQKHGNFKHNVANDGANQRFVDLLRLPSVLFGVLTVVLTFLAARMISTDRWTPVVAAAIVAGVPKFVFLSGVINNDNLSNVLGGGALAAAVAFVIRPPSSRWMRGLASAGLGALAGALLLTKLTGLLLAPGLVVAVWLVARRPSEWLELFGYFLAGALVICGWWLVYNQIHYGDPLALHATQVHEHAVLPGDRRQGSLLHQLFVVVPKTVWGTFWYDSGWNQFSWRWYSYLPFWLLAAAGILGLVWTSVRHRARATSAGASALARQAIFVTTLLAIGGFASVWVVGAQTNTEEGRLAFMGLPAIALLVALGYERLRIWPAVRFVLPLIGLVGVFVAIRTDVIAAYLPH